MNSKPLGMAPHCFYLQSSKTAIHALLVTLCVVIGGFFFCFQMCEEVVEIWVVFLSMESRGLSIAHLELGWAHDTQVHQRRKCFCLIVYEFIS